MTVLQSSSSEQTPFLGHPILWHCICGPQKSGSCANEFTSSTKSEQLCCISRYSWVLRLMLVEKSYNLLLDLYYNNICLAPSKYFTKYSKFNLRLWYSPWSMFQSFIECFFLFCYHLWGILEHLFYSKLTQLSFELFQNAMAYDRNYLWAEKFV